jgi:hypothetical protein
MSNITIISIFLAVCISLTYLFKEKDNFVFRQLVSAFGYYYRYQKLTFREHFIQSFILIIGLLGYSLFFLQHVVPFTFSSKLFFIFCAVLLVFVMLKLTIMRMYFSCFYGKEANNILNQYVRLIAIGGIFSFIAFILLRFTPETTHIVWNILTIIFYIIISLSYCYLLFKYFFNRFELSLHFILYLCTLEILPLLVAYRAVGEMVKLTI